MTLNMVHMHNDHILFHEKFLGPEIANISKKWYKSSSNFRTAQTINVKVESEVQQFQIVSDGPEDLEAEVLNQSEVSNLISQSEHLPDPSWRCRGRWARRRGWCTPRRGRWWRSGRPPASAPPSCAAPSAGEVGSSFSQNSICCSGMEKWNENLKKWNSSSLIFCKFSARY